LQAGLSDKFPPYFYLQLEVIVLRLASILGVYNPESKGLLAEPRPFNASGQANLLVCQQ
jgi:hypothetical protein